MMPFSLFFDKFKVQIVVILLIIMAGMVVFHYTRVGLLESSLDSAQKRNGTLVVENSTLSAANKKAVADIALQNIAVAGLKAAGEEQSRLAKEELAKVKREKQVWDSKFDTLFKKPLGNNDCTNAFTLLGNYQSIRVAELMEVLP